MLRSLILKYQLKMFVCFQVTRVNFVVQIVIIKSQFNFWTNLNVIKEFSIYDAIKLFVFFLVFHGVWYRNNSLSFCFLFLIPNYHLVVWTLLCLPISFFPSLFISCSDSRFVGLTKFFELYARLGVGGCDAWKNLFRTAFKLSSSVFAFQVARA